MNIIHEGFNSCSSSYELPTYSSPLADMPTFLRENKVDVFLKNGESFPTVKMTPLKYIKRFFHIRIDEDYDDLTIIGRYEPSGALNQYEFVRYGVCNKCGMIERLG